MKFVHALHDARRLKTRLLNRKYYDTLRQRRLGAGEEAHYRCFDETRSIFVHIPKTAGVSLTRSLYGTRAGRHASIATYQMAFPAKDFYAYFKFTFVRNPWDRLYSAYRFLSAGAMGERHDLAWIEANLSGARDFEDFVMNHLTRPEIRSFVHFRDQESFLRDVVTKRVGVDFVGRFETLSEDFAIAAARIGRDTTLPHLNRTKVAGSYRDAYSTKMARRAGEVYAVDAALFGYDF